jgi:hypothetical protein
VIRTDETHERDRECERRVVAAVRREACAEVLRSRERGGLFGASCDADLRQYLRLYVDGGDSGVLCNSGPVGNDSAFEVFGVAAVGSAQRTVSDCSGDGGSGALDAWSNVGGSGSCLGGVLGAAREPDGFGANGVEHVVPCDTSSASGDGVVEACGVVASSSAQTSVSGGSGDGGGAFGALLRAGESGTCFDGAPCHATSARRAATAQARHRRLRAVVRTTVAARWMRRRVSAGRALALVRSALRVRPAVLARMVMGLPCRAQSNRRAATARSAGCSGV